MTETKDSVRHPALLPPYSQLNEPFLLFNTAKPDALDMHPLRGLLEHGPYSQSALAQFTPQIRVLLVGPKGGQQQVRQLLNSLVKRHKSSDKAGYTPDFPGIQQALHIQLASAPAQTHIEWPDELRYLPGEGPATQRLVALFTNTVSRLAASRADFDVAMVHLPDAWDPATRAAGFDAHHVLKVIAAQANIPTQLVNDRVFTFNMVAQRSWRLSIALYVKAGGIPWKLAPLSGVPDSTAYIGLGYAVRRNQGEAHFVTCCSQVFDTDGGGMQFVAYEAQDAISGDIDEARRNPYLSRDDMRSVMARTLRVYQARNAGRVPRRVVLHKRTPFRGDELQGARDALSAIEELECVELTSATSWRGVWIRAPKPGQKLGEPDGYPTPRGVLLPVSGTEALLWSAGNAPGVSSQGNYYQGGKSIPRPLLLRRHAGAGPLELAGIEALALTKMDWNNDALYDPAPVTIQYANRLAQILDRGGSLPATEYPYRLFM